MGPAFRPSQSESFKKTSIILISLESDKWPCMSKRSIFVEVTMIARDWFLSKYVVRLLFEEDKDIDSEQFQYRRSLYEIEHTVLKYLIVDTNCNCVILKIRYFECEVWKRPYVLVTVRRI